MMALHELDAEDRDLVSLVATGWTNEEIAARLRTTVHAVERRTTRLLTRLGFDTRTQLIAATVLDDI